jgi:hypothetical protein
VQELVVEHVLGWTIVIDAVEDEAQLAQMVIDLGRVDHVSLVQGVPEAAVIEQHALAFVQGCDLRPTGSQPRPCLHGLIGQLAECLLNKFVDDADRHRSIMPDGGPVRNFVLVARRDLHGFGPWAGEDHA